MLYTKPSNMSYTDLAIWIDQHKDLNCDTETFFNYIYALCDMVARKKKWFQYEDEREDFSCYFAASIFNRYQSREDTPTSSLNYIKKVAGFKKIDYTREQWQQNITPVILPENTDKRYDYSYDDYVVASSIPFLQAEFNDYMRCIPKTINGIINRELKHLNSISRQRIAQSCMLSILNLITLPNKSKNRVSGIYRSEDVRECLVNRLYDEQRTEDWAIPFRLSDDETSLMYKVLESILNTLSEDIKDMIMEKQSLCSFADDIKNDFVTNMMFEDEGDLTETQEDW